MKVGGAFNKMNNRTMKFNRFSLFFSILFLPVTSYAHGPFPVSLVNAPIPPVPGLMEGDDPIIVDKDMAIALGKALFWDMNVGSDGIACGSCHFHAGVDRRVKNQRNTGTKSSESTGGTFEINAANGANQALRNSDFPLYKLLDPFDKDSELVFNSDDVISSSGTFSGEFHYASPLGGMNDDCARAADPVHNVNGVGVRRVEPRNAPTMINAIFNHRNFWDGRANNIFNGSSGWGDRDPDPDTGVWVLNSSGKVEKERLHLINSSLASQAIETLQSDTEMACRDRKLPDLGRKILSQRPLSRQNVHPDDSVLGALSYSRSTGKLKQGLKTSYEEMVRLAFNEKYWSYTLRDSFGRPQAQNSQPYNQMEANFALFIGLALQVYESTLVSDQAPIDTVTRGDVGRPVFDDELINKGVEFFVAAHCNLCHAGVTMSTAAIVTNSMILQDDPDAFGGRFNARFSGISIFENGVGRAKVVKGESLFDLGFMNTGVGDPMSDLGVGGVDDFGNSLSFTDQYIGFLVDNKQLGVDPKIDNIFACEFEESLAAGFDTNDFTFGPSDGIKEDPNNEGCLIPPTAYIPTEATALSNLNGPKMQVATKAAFKMPTLRNVELTGPYMHNGSMATLDQVIEFYFRNGNFRNDNLNTLVDSIDRGSDENGNPNDMGPIVAALKAFLNTFTDDRVRYERAPFDHPQIKVPHGAEKDETSVTPGNSLGEEFAKEELLIIPAVGASGRQEPLQPFDTFLIQDEVAAEASLSVSPRISTTEFSPSLKVRASNYNENDEF